MVARSGCGTPCEHISRLGTPTISALVSSRRGNPVNQVVTPTDNQQELTFAIFLAVKVWACSKKTQKSLTRRIL